ncbi:hypothetical protein [Mycobacterium sp. SMC-17]|uniref:hypothetical protein n=1 Tax=Mycobacterium sp. SMC-17 TaxID=3381628 RepID=UPI0038777388
MIHLFAAGVHQSLAVLVADHRTHHTIVTDAVHGALQAVVNSFSWWIGRSLTERLGLGGIATVILTAGVLGLITRATAGPVTRLWRSTIDHRAETSTIRR